MNEHQAKETPSSLDPLSLALEQAKAVRRRWIFAFLSLLVMAIWVGALSVWFDNIAEVASKLDELAGVRFAAQFKFGALFGPAIAVLAAIVAAFLPGRSMRRVFIALAASSVFAGAYEAKEYVRFRAESEKELAAKANSDREIAIRERFLEASERFTPTLLGVKQRPPFLADQLTPENIALNRKRLAHIVADAHTMIETVDELEKGGFPLTEEPRARAAAQKIIPFLQKMDAVLLLLQSTPGKWKISPEEGVVFEAEAEQAALGRLMADMMAARP
jgi:hypothetical protein